MMIELRVPCSDMHYVIVKDLENELRNYGEVGIDLRDVSVVVWVSTARSKEISWFNLTSRLVEVVGRDLVVEIRGNRVVMR